MKVAIVHEMLIKLGGAENVVSDFLELYPEADIYTLIYDEEKVKHRFPREKVTVAEKTQKVYSLFKKPRLCLPWMRSAIESFDFSQYDLVISSSSGFAHGCITDKNTKHVVYYHSPSRYLWDWTHKVREEIGAKYGLKSLLVGMLFKKLRMWDFEASKRHDVTVANSQEVAKRIQKFYHRESQIIYPSVYTDRFYVGKKPLSEREYYVITSALTPFKKVDLLVKFFNTLGHPLKVIGSGDQELELEEMAKENIEFLGRVSNKEIGKIYEEARGFILPGKEDFGIAVVEAMAAGVPAFGLASGGLLETQDPGVTGDFFFEHDGSDFLEYFRNFHIRISENVFDSKAIREHAQKFSKKHFLESFQKIVENS